MVRADEGEVPELQEAEKKEDPAAFFNSDTLKMDAIKSNHVQGVNEPWQGAEIIKSNLMPPTNGHTRTVQQLNFHTKI